MCPGPAGAPADHCTRQICIQCLLGDCSTATIQTLKVTYYRKERNNRRGQENWKTFGSDDNGGTSSMVSRRCFIFHEDASYVYLGCRSRTKDSSVHSTFHLTFASNRNNKYLYFSRECKKKDDLSGCHIQAKETTAVTMKETRKNNNNKCKPQGSIKSERHVKAH